MPAEPPLLLDDPVTPLLELLLEEELELPDDELLEEELELVELPDDELDVELEEELDAPDATGLESPPPHAVANSVAATKTLSLS